MSTISFFGTLVDTIKSHYELPEILAVAAMQSVRSHAGGSDSVFRVATQSQSYVLRPYRTELPASIELHNHFLRWAENDQFSMTQRIVPTRQGKDFFESDGRNWWLSFYIEADPVFEWTQPTWNAEICQQSGAALARLHQALRAFERECLSPPVSRSTEKSALHLLDKRLADAFLKAPQLTCEWELIAPSIAVALRSIKESRYSVEQLVHGDFHPGNLLFKGKAAIAIIDFEYLNFEPPIYDLAYALVMFCAQWNGSSFDMEKLKAFLIGYLSALGQVEPAAEIETGKLIPYMTLAAAVCLTWFLDRGLDNRIAQHFVCVVKQLENLSTMDISQAIGRV